MALRPTIYRARIDLSDLEQDFYTSLNLTLAQHPSESLERMMVRLLALCHNARLEPQFTTGLSTPGEPDLWAHTLEGEMRLWIDVGEPTFDRIKKAARLAQTVKVYSFNSKSDVWWKQEAGSFGALPVTVWQCPWGQVQALAGLVQKTMDFSISLAGDTIYVSAANASCEVTLKPLQGLA